MLDELTRRKVKISRIIRKNASNLINLIGLMTCLNIPKPVFQRTDRKRILIMINTIRRGGAERVASRLASGFAKTCDVVLLYNYTDDSEYQFDPRVQIIRMPEFYYDSSLHMSSLYVRKLKMVFHIDVSLSLLHRMNCRNVYSKGRECVIVSERNNPKIAYPEYFEKCREIYDRADCVVFQTREVQAMFSEKTQSHSIILPNPVAVTCLASEKREPRIVNVARLHKDKNQELLIRSFSAFHSKHGEYTLSIYGNGPMKQELQELAINLGLKDRVFFHGNVPDIHEQIADAGMFVLSSNTEGMPNALLEAMMMGLPCISTKCTGAKEVIKNKKNGLLTELGDANDLTKAMLYMADHPNEAETMRKNAMKTADSFSSEKVIRQWLELVTEECVSK